MARLKSSAIIAALLMGAGLAGCSHEGRRADLGSDMGLHFNTAGGAATLAYGRANSDDVGLVLQCQTGSGQVDVSDVSRSRSAVGLTLISGDARTDLPTRLDNVTGQPILWAQTSLSAPALKAFRRNGRIGVTSPGARYAVTANRRERSDVERFFTACESA